MLADALNDASAQSDYVLALLESIHMHMEEIDQWLSAITDLQDSIVRDRAFTVDRLALLAIAETKRLKRDADGGLDKLP
jgi:hypothetical protein